MNWKLLKDMKCPKCECKISEQFLCGELGSGCKTSAGYFSCESCEFRIGKAKFEDIVKNLYNKPERRGKGSYSSEENNLSGLNNLGHEGISEDFSDSKFLD